MKLVKILNKALLTRKSALLHDILWIPVAVFSAYWLRFNLETIPPSFKETCWQMVLIATPVFAISFFSFGLYRGVWRFGSFQDIWRVMKSVSMATLILALLSIFLFRLDGVPRTVFVLTPLFQLVAMSAPRLFYRLLKGHHHYSEEDLLPRTIIVGSGEKAAKVIKKALSDSTMLPIALVSARNNHAKSTLYGIQTIGNVDKLDFFVEKLKIKQVVIADSSNESDLVKHVCEKCFVQGVSYLINENDKIRPVKLEDLLGRSSDTSDNESCSKNLKGKRVLITGGGGSIGTELCRQIARQQPGQVIVFDHAEYNLYAIERELKNLFPEINLKAVLGNVTNHDRVNWLFQTYTPDIIFHAASYKHVPILEINPAEGVQNNIFGTKVMADAADKFGASRFVLVSTDKAVNPANIMGATKRIAELYCQNLSLHSKTKYITTRFGNVLNSAGSVVPLFTEQIRQGGPVTLTHKKIKRYFMTIQEASNLILEAGALGMGGEIFVLDMGEPVYIKDVAEHLIRLNGNVPGKDITIEYIGLRPGEKLFEEIFHKSENLQGTVHPKLLLARARHFDWDNLKQELMTLEQAFRDRDTSLIFNQLKTMVPEYTGKPDNNDVGKISRKNESASISKLKII